MPVGTEDSGFAMRPDRGNPTRMARPQGTQGDVVQAKTSKEGPQDLTHPNKRPQRQPGGKPSSNPVRSPFFQPLNSPFSPLLPPLTYPAGSFLSLTQATVSLDLLAQPPADSAP